MKYTTEVTIDLPRDRVIDIFDNADNIKHWQPEMVSYEHMSGEPGQVGAKAKMVFDIRGKQVEMIETITHRDLPDAIHVTFTTDGVVNTMDNFFTEITPNQTKWVSHADFQCKGFGMKMMMALMPGAFKKETLRYMKLFKEFAEGQGV